MRQLSRAFLMILICAAIARLAPAQQLAGRIEGQAVDAQGARVPGAAITATHEETNTIYRATTESDGRFAIPTVRLGRYIVSAEAPGFQRAIISGVLVEIGGTAIVNIPLQVGALRKR